MTVLWRKRWAFDCVLTVAAQAELEEGREVSGVVKKDQHYYFKIKVRKDKNGVRIQVKF